MSAARIFLVWSMNWGYFRNMWKSRASEELELEKFPNWNRWKMYSKINSKFFPSTTVNAPNSIFHIFLRVSLIIISGHFYLLRFRSQLVGNPAYYYRSQMGLNIFFIVFQNQRNGGDIVREFSFLSRAGNYWADELFELSNGTTNMTYNTQFAGNVGLLKPCCKVTDSGKKVEINKIFI